MDMDMYRDMDREMDMGHGAAAHCLQSGNPVSPGTAQCGTWL